MSRRVLPVIGACAVLTINPVASLDPDIREDPAAIAACGKLVSRKYAVFVSNGDGLYAPSDPYNAYTVRFILQGKPMDYPDRCIDSTMSVPLVPMSYKTHPSSREPLKLSKPLPWEDCYITGFDYAKVRSPTMFTELPIGYTMDREELRLHDRFMRADVAKKRDLLYNRSQAFTETRTSTTGFVSFSLDPDPSAIPTSAVPADGKNVAAPVDSESTPAVEPESDGQSLDELFQNLLAHPPSPGKTIVNFTHDLSTVTELIPPAEYFKEVEAIASIAAEAWPRVARVKAQAIREAVAEAERVNAQAYDDLTNKRVVEHLTLRSRVSRAASRVKTKGRNIARRILRFSHLSRNKSVPGN
ncbi:hypothetical protein C8R46DRAFT_1229520 [Mycena filopes]|nr:hypothetical protein C8R46DRAFT_1229520 [Mycena filopes]